MTVQEAIATLSKALREDPDYRYSWQSNIAMFCYDAIKRDSENIYEACNAGANEFLNILCMERP